MEKPFISRVKIKNYKSIAHCDVQLGELQFLVGRNGSGKSNFLDALAFVRDVLEFNNLEKAINDRVGSIFRLWKEKTELIEMELNFGMEIEFNLSNGDNGVFAFHIRKEVTNCIVAAESCRIEQNGKTKKYKTENGKLSSGDPKRFPPVASDRFYLQNMSAYDEFRSLYDALRKMKIYNFVPQHIPLLDETISNSLFMADGNNIAQVVSELTDNAKNRIREYLQLVVPDICDFRFREVGKEGREEGKYLVFQHKSGIFPHESMSDGTLRALCVLTALLQERKDDKNSHPMLVGIEEPETGLHARATGALLGAIMEAVDMRQVIIATHSTEMFDDKDITTEQILPVERRDSGTVIAPLENITKDMLREHLTTAGELLRQDHLQPESSSSASDK